MNNIHINSMIDHTNLKQNAKVEDIEKLCKEAVEYKFASVCVNPVYIKLVSRLLAGSDVAPCCVIGFPLGASTTRVKAFEAADAIKNGAREVDMVINVGLIKSNDWDAVKEDILAVYDEAKGKAKLKVILETCLLTAEEIIHSCLICKEIGVDFVKTSTGFSTGGAKEEDVQLMRKIVGEEIGVKASGGIRSYDDAVKMIEAGANRIGTSAGIAIATASDGK